MCPSLVISFGLQPPSNVVHPEGLAPSKVHDFAVSADSTGAGSSASYYAGLSAAIKIAQQVTGDELTRWRDAAAPVEGSKEPRVKDEEDEGDEEEEEEPENS